MKFMRKLLCLSYFEHRTNEYVQSKVESLVGNSSCHRPVTESDMVWPHGMAAYAELLCSAPSIKFVGEGGRWTDNMMERPSVTRTDI